MLRNVYAARGVRQFSSKPLKPFKMETWHAPVMLPDHFAGSEILHDPLYNKGTAFPMRERDRFGIRGLIPTRVFTLEEQAKRQYIGFQRIKLPFMKQIDYSGLSEEEALEFKEMLNNEQAVQRYEYMAQLKDRNEVLYYRILCEHIEELAPVVYTPTIGVACQRAGNIFRRARGLYISIEDRGHIHSVVSNCPLEDVDITVMTDGSRILGLGDLGVHGMAIPIGKLSLYTAAGGLDPGRCLPICIDVGTDNETLLKDPLYLGIRRKRLEGPEFYEFMDEVIEAIVTRYPKIMLHFEDFRNPRADDLLERYRKQLCVFNDDIQGTGAMALSALMSGMRVKGKDPSDIKHQKIVCLGGGSAGIGVCHAILEGMKTAGASHAEAQANFWVIDVDGLITADRGEDKLLTGQSTFARKDLPGGMSLVDVIKEVKPDILLGLTGVGGTFTEDVLRSMGDAVERPIIFAMSNPTPKAECTAEQAYEFTDGRCIFAGGSPFPDVVRDGKVVMSPSQANNMYIFPGLGLGIIGVKAKVVSDEMLYICAEIVAGCLTEEELADGKLFPPIKDIRSVSLKIAVAIAQQAQKEGVATKEIPEEFETLEAYMEHLMWQPEYRELVQSFY